MFLHVWSLYMLLCMSEVCWVMFEWFIVWKSNQVGHSRSKGTDTRASVPIRLGHFRPWVSIHEGAVSVHVRYFGHVYRYTWGCTDTAFWFWNSVFENGTRVPIHLLGVSIQVVVKSDLGWKFPVYRYTPWVYRYRPELYNFLSGKSFEFFCFDPWMFELQLSMFEWLFWVEF